MSAARRLPPAARRLGGLRREPGMERAGGAAAQEERRRRLQEYLAAKGKLKCSGTKPYLKDRTNHPNPLLKPLAKPEHVARSKEDVVASVAKGARRDDRPGVRSTQRAGLGPQQRPSKPPQRAAAPSGQLRKSTQPSSTNPSARPRGKLPASTSPQLSAGRTEEAAKEAGAAVPLPGAPRSLSEGLQERLLCNKENIPGEAPSEPASSGTFEPDGNGHRRAVAHGPTSTTAPRASQGPKDRANSHQKREGLIQHQLGKSLPGTKEASQKQSSKTRASQPAPFQTLSRAWLHKKTGAKPESVNTARLPLGKAAGTLPAGNFKHHSGAPQLKRSPARPPASSRLQGAAKLGCTKRCSPRLAGAGQRPAARGEPGGKDTKTAPRGHAVTARAMGPAATARSALGSKTRPLERDVKTRKERLQGPVLAPASVQAKRVPKTPTPEDRKKQLQEWLASKGKSYKRPPMTLPPKKPVKDKLISRSSVKEEKKERPEQSCSDRINSILTDYLKLIEEGVPSEELLEMLARVPHAETFAKFWICKAKLLARAGPFDATGLYRDAVCAGAVPLQELRDFILHILKSTERPQEGEQSEAPVVCEAATPCPGEGPHAAETPSLTGKHPPSLPGSAIKLQILSIPRPKEWPQGQELKFLTPVRRSQRVEWAGSRYPPMLKDHDTVVSSLEEILDGEEESELFFRKNEALPEVTETEILAL
ncbi:cytoskeleton-associated protein 2-like [Nothoprocta perdicaria]|uniref:cytoskeleton-associated protein 2-like n=1 Tax=Nothoprocta perdicaria TaxID=30464 RepID=UPI000E1BF727|nr:cytoskeleton-associated protein 2-like [Nothoprocta perdicaria]